MTVFAAMAVAGCKQPPPPVATHSIAGHVSGDVVAGVGISLGDPALTTITDASGSYEISGLIDGSYTVTASKSGYTFSPPSIVVTLGGADVVGQDFTASAIPETFSISGTIIGSPTAGVSVSLAGTAAGATITDGNGNYSFTGLANGSYTVTPSETGCMIEPANLDVTVAGSSVVGQNFRAYVWSSFSSGTTEPLNGIWGSSSDDIWAVGDSGTILHWNGSTWSRVPSGTAERLTSVWGTSSNDVWAVGWFGTILHWDGSVWSTVPSGTAEEDFLGVWGSSSGDVWAVGSIVSHWDGAAWSREATATTALTTGACVGGCWLQAIWGSSSDDVWAVGGLNPGGALVVRWNGSSWSIAYPDAIGPRTPDPGFLGVWGSSPGDVWAVGPQHPSPLGQIFHWDGSIWSSNATPDSRRGISGTSTNDVWAVGLFYILHWNGSAWTRLTAEESTILNAVWAGSSTDVWAVGEGGTVLHWQ